MEAEDSDDVKVEFDGSEDDCEKQRPEDKEQVSDRKSQSLRDEHNDAGRLFEAQQRRRSRSSWRSVKKKLICAKNQGVEDTWPEKEEERQLFQMQEERRNLKC